MGGVSIDVDAPTPFPSDIEIAEAADITPVVDVARDTLGIPADVLDPYGRDKAKVRARPAGRGGPADGQAHPGLGDHADAGRRGEDDRSRSAWRRACGGSASGRRWRCGSRRWARSSAARGGRPAAGRAGSSRRTRSTSSSPATSTRSPPPTTCWPRRSTTGSTSATPRSTRARSSGSGSLDMNDRALRQIVIGLGGRGQGRPARVRASTSRRPARSWPSSAWPTRRPTSGPGSTASSSATTATGSPVLAGEMRA